ncbi:MAG TPA: hypothetical protein ENI27_03435 [bacterium]|nr:hypothetical protein [bacterium]
MGLFTNDTALDNLLNRYTTCKQITINNTQPTGKTDATSTATMIGISTHLNFDALTNSTMSNGGRKLTVQITTDIAIPSSGVASHICLISSSTMFFVTQCTTRALTTADTATIPAWRIDVNDPTTG